MGNNMNKRLTIDFKFYDKGYNLCDFTVQAPIDRRYKLCYSCYQKEDGEIKIVSVPRGINPNFDEYGADFLELNYDMLMNLIMEQREAI